MMIQLDIIFHSVLWFLLIHITKIESLRINTPNGNELYENFMLVESAVF